MRKENDTDPPSGPDTEPSSDRSDDRERSDLPVRRGESGTLIDAPRKGAKLVLEQGADLYFSACRRIAALLNDRD